MKKSTRKLSIAMIGVVTMLFTMLPLTAAAYTIDNLGFLFSAGDTITAPGTLKVGVTELFTSPFTAGRVDATYLGYEAGHLDYLRDSGGTNIFGNNGLSTPGATAVIDVATAYFTDATDNVPSAVFLTAMINLKMYSLSGTYLESYTDGQGWFDSAYNYYVVGFGDSAGDGDFDDLVIAVKGNPVPIPGAVWLLGSGLLGLVGIRRRKK